MTCVKTYWPAYIGAPAIKTSRRGRKTPEKIQVDNESKHHFTENYQLVILSSTNNVGTPVRLCLTTLLQSHTEDDDGRHEGNCRGIRLCGGTRRHAPESHPRSS